MKDTFYFFFFFATITYRSSTTTFFAIRSISFSGFLGRSVLCFTLGILSFLCIYYLSFFLFLFWLM